MRKIKYSVKRDAMKIEKSKFGKFNREKDVIHDAHKVISKINLKKFRRYGLRALNRQIVTIYKIRPKYDQCNR